LISVNLRSAKIPTVWQKSAGNNQSNPRSTFMSAARGGLDENSLKERYEMKRFIIALGATTALMSGAALAATEIDADGDGVFSYDEMVAAFPEMTEETYIAVDANADGMVDTEELAAAQEVGLVPPTEG